MTASDFQAKDESQTAGLRLHHVVALRLYTSNSYPLFNNPMREGKKPHPIRVTMYVLDEALKKMRAAAKAPMQAPLQDYQRGTAFSLEVSMPKCKAANS